MFIKRMSFDYPGGNDKHPNVLVLHEHNDLVCGINVHYITNVELEEFMQSIPVFWDNFESRNNVTYCRLYEPYIFEEAYRTYKRSRMSNVEEEILELEK